MYSGERWRPQVGGVEDIGVVAILVKPVHGVSEGPVSRAPPDQREICVLRPVERRRAHFCPGHLELAQALAHHLCPVLRVLIGEVALFVVLIAANLEDSLGMARKRTRRDPRFGEGVPLVFTFQLVEVLLGEQSSPVYDTSSKWKCDLSMVLTEL